MHRHAAHMLCMPTIENSLPHAYGKEKLSVQMFEMSLVYLINGRNENVCECVCVCGESMQSFVPLLVFVYSSVAPFMLLLKRFMFVIIGSLHLVQN